MLIEYVHIPAKEERVGNARVTKIEGPEEPPTVLEEETVKGLGTSVPKYSDQLGSYIYLNFSRESHQS